MLTCSIKGKIATALGALSFAVAGRTLRGDHTAFVVGSHDPFGISAYTGTSHPSGLGSVNVGALGVSGYFNALSGGDHGGAAGNIGITRFGDSETQLAGLAIHATDTAGASHSLSTLNDPALTDIVNDLNAFTGGGDLVIKAFPYTAAPPQYAEALTSLSAGEAANSGQPFDILLVAANPGDIAAVNFVWSLHLEGEVGNLDGITALSITDVGAINVPAVPEPATIATLALLTTVLLRRRRRTHAESRISRGT